MFQGYENGGTEKWPTNMSSVSHFWNGFWNISCVVTSSNIAFIRPFASMFSTFMILESGFLTS